VAGLWHLRDPDPTAEIQTIYPDGFCELIVHFGTPPQCHEGGGWHVQARTLFAAQRLGAVRLRRDAAIDCLGVRLRPEASALLGAEVLRRSRERIVDLAVIDPALSRALRVAASAYIAGDTARLDRLLARRFAAHDLDDAVARAVRRIRESGGQMRIESVARDAGVGLRSLQTRFRRAVGLTPKEFSRLMRLQATLRALDAGDATLTDVALDHGFADQAHATRELRRVTGLAPTRLRAALRTDRDGDAAVRLAAAFVRGRER
jgi:AraC-like DNA-binding protein